jgi:hypothetical protein
MTRSIICGLLGLLSVVTLGTLPVACQSGGVGDPCTPEDEYNPDFAGFKVSEENIESRSFQCATRICLVNHFQGRVSCPLGQDPLDVAGSRKPCNGLKDTTCPTNARGVKEICVEASTLAPDCNPANGDKDCAGVSGTHCDKARKLCTCVSGGSAPAGFYCGGDSLYKSYACHTPGACQTAGGKAADNAGKDCCVPGTDTPVVAPVCGQCASKGNRNADQSVYCSCRCGVADGEPADPNFNFCACPTGFSCTQIRRNVGLGDAQITGKYCIKEGTGYNGDPFSCGEVAGHFDSTCRGTPPLSNPSGP